VSKDENARRLIVTTDRGSVRVLTLNRPEKANALSRPLLLELDAELDRARDDANVRVVVFRGAGKGFSSGADLDEGIAAGRERNFTPREPMEDYRNLKWTLERWLKIWDFPKPTIAQIHGYCIGIAMQFAAVCDITLIAEDAIVQWPKIRGGGGYLSPFWVHLVGPKRAKEMSFISGSQIDGTTAAAWGWANHAVPRDELEQATIEMAARIAYSSSDILEIKKAAINRMVEGSGFRSNLLVGALNDAVPHASRIGETRHRTLGERGVRAANEQWSKEMDAAVAEALQNEVSATADDD
jgi:enoyl-CoA hydratase